ncbi:flagellar biosynthetic protein FliR [Pirellulales bacterium]|nr:flagellar biosynthetic protein FliR [Pirellulales bacterium]
MEFLETFLVNQFATFVLVLARIGALIMTAPVLGTKAAPVRVRAFLAVGLTLIVVPMQSGPPATDVGNMAVLIQDIFSEALVGLLLGLGIMIFLSGIQLTGQIISQLGGTALAESFDPTLDSNAPVIAQMFYFLALAMFVLVGGHTMLIEAILETYVWLPPGAAQMGESYVESLTQVLSQSFLLGVRAAAPAMTALCLATLVLGLVGRTLPQINILVVGFGVNALLTLASLFVSIGAIAWAFPEHIAGAIDQFLRAIRIAAEGSAPSG